MRKKQILSVLLVCAVLTAATTLLYGKSKAGKTVGTLSTNETVASSNADETSSVPGTEETVAKVDTNESAVKVNTNNASSVLTCSILKVGKADAIILEANEQTMVIDAGEEDDGIEVVEFLKGKGISQVDVLIVTHYDKDHVGGADILVTELPVNRVIIPDYVGTSTEYSDFINALAKNNITPERLNSDTEFSLGDAQIRVSPPKSYEIPSGAVEFDNNFSLIAEVIHGENRLLFTGDIEKDRIYELVEDGSLSPCDFMKAPHHGVYTVALDDLLKAVQPKYAVICSSDKNPADQSTLELFKQYGVDTLETRYGNITLISDGNNLELHQ